jgi:hypothetical protein
MRTLALALLPLLLAACTSADRIELDPGSLRFMGRGKSAKVHATPREKNGRPVPDQVCAWSSSDEKVATVQGAHNNGTVTAVGPGAAAIRCTIGSVTGEVQVTVRVVARVTVRPDRAELKMLDDPAPLALEVQAFDDQGEPVTGRVAQVSCASEDVCRGDARGQLWGVGAGESTARITVEGAEASIPVKVTDARSAAARPKAVKGNPMEAIEREVRAREAREAAAKKR